MSSSPASTIRDLATWEYWPDAPPDDLARLIPHDAHTQDVFREVVHALHIDDTDTVPPYSRGYIHWEETEREQIYDTDGVEQDEGGALPAVSGFYRLTRQQIVDQGPSKWLFGCGKPGYDVAFILDRRENRNNNKIHSRHGTLVYHDGAIKLVADKLQLVVQDKFGVCKRSLRRPDDKNAQSPHIHTMQDGDRIAIGKLNFRIELLQQNLAQNSRDVKIPVFTPTPSADTITLRRYILTSAFAGGSYGIAYGARDPWTGLEYVIKRIVSKTEAAERAVQNEIRLLQACDHPHIVKLEEHWSPTPPIIEERGTINVKEFYLVMKPVTQMTVDDVIRELKKVDASERVSTTKLMLAQMGSAVEYLHNKEIMHRDFKPSNIGVDCRGSRTFVLLDFGHAQQGALSDDHYKGTLAYLAPEVKRLKDKNLPNVKYGLKVDIWGLGLVCVQTLLARELFTEEDVADMLESWAAAEVLQTEKDLKDVLHMMLRKDPELRVSAQRLNELLRSAKILTQSSCE